MHPLKTVLGIVLLGFLGFGALAAEAAPKLTSPGRSAPTTHATHATDARAGTSEVARFPSKASPGLRGRGKAWIQGATTYKWALIIIQRWNGSYWVNQKSGYASEYGRYTFQVPARQYYRVYGEITFGYSLTMAPCTGPYCGPSILNCTETRYGTSGWVWARRGRVYQVGVSISTTANQDCG